MCVTPLRSQGGEGNEVVVTRKIHLKGKSPPQGCVSTADKELGLRNCLVSFTTVGEQAKDSKDKN